MELILRLIAVLMVPVVSIAGILLWAASGQRTRRLWITAIGIALAVVVGLAVWQASYENPEAPFYAVALLGIAPVAVMALVVGFAVRNDWSRVITGLLVIAVGATTSVATALWAYSLA